VCGALFAVTSSIRMRFIQFLAAVFAILSNVKFIGAVDDDGDSQVSVAEDGNNRTDVPTTDPVNRVDELRSKLLFDFVNSSSTTNVQIRRNRSPDAVAEVVASQFGQAFHERLAKMYAKAVTPECRMKIAEHFGYFINAIAKEETLPFVDVKFTNECNETVYDDWSSLPKGMNIGDIQNRTYQPNRNESYYISDPDRLKLLYVILAHDNANATIRLIEALYEKGFLHQFVVHVDAKYDDTQTTLVKYATTRTDVHVVPDPYRVRVNWGGFSMVNATLQALRFTFALDAYDDINGKPRRALMFNKLIHMSSSTYPIASNPEIRHKLASYPMDANFLHVIMQPTHPNPYVWHYFVECDDAIHRIYQMPHLRRDVHGISLYTSSQWFIISRQFAHYLAVATPGTMVDQYLRYIEHVVVADETFFGTVLRHTHFCHHHHNQNFVHLQFDRWENAIPVEQRDSRKCPMPNPDHCGRSPTTMTLDYADIMELSADLFARKVRGSRALDHISYI
jgi:Core-2/I-Branching enzyme